MEILDKLRNKVIVSVQAMKNEPFYDENAIIAMMKSVVSAGASGLRLAGERDIKNAKKLFDVPVIGITKPDIIPDNYKEIVYITPDVKNAQNIIDAGADIIAADATLRKRPKDTIKDILDCIKSSKKIAMADISTFEEGLNARELGFDIISTTLSGYTSYTDCDLKTPDFELLEKLVKEINCPIFLEGRIWNAEEVDKAFEIGAYAVVIGSAITRPQLITKRFVERGQK